MEPLIIFGVVLALALNFVNGLNDAAHSIATVVATKSLSPWRAVLLTSLCNMLGPFIFTTAVATTIGTAIVHPGSLTPISIIVAMGAAISLVFVATRSGIPISSSHAMVGGLLGAGIAVFGPAAVIVPGTATFVDLGIAALGGAVTGAAVLGILTAALKGDVRTGILIGTACGGTLVIPILMLAGMLKITGLLAIVLFIFISPVMGVSSAFLFNIIISHLFQHRKQNRVRRIFQPLHVIACLFQAAGHGANDGQHAVGVIAALLVSAGVLSTFSIPPWVLLSSAVAIGLGTVFGGWDVVDKMAKKITRIRPYQGFTAATAGSATLAMVTSYGVPVSSTHVISGAIVGVGVTRGKTAVQWEVVREMMTAWVITIPLALVVSYAGYLIVSTFMNLLFL
ncbi:MAG: inorganic phosphate transporter [Methanoregula sp.]|nr:inorganic phosphate transporter [Methanoregula sp.]